MVIHLGLASEGVSIGGPSHSTVIGWVPLRSGTVVWGTHAIAVESVPLDSKLFHIEQFIVKTPIPNYE